MKFRVSFKTPDAVDHGIEQELSYMSVDENETFEESLEKKEEMKALLESCASKFVEYGECITVEFDTDANTCVVLPRRG